MLAEHLQSPAVTRRALATTRCNTRKHAKALELPQPYDSGGRTVWCDMGSSSIFEDDVEIIRNADLFTEEHTSAEILCRDDVMQDYVNALKPVYKGRPPRNAFLYGDTGVGKTAATKYLLQELDADIDARNADAPGDERGFTYVRVNCQNLAPADGTASSYQVAIALVNELAVACHHLDLDTTAILEAVIPT